MRRLFVAAVAAAAVATLVGTGPTACVNPRDSYDDYIARTNDVRGVFTRDAAAFEASAPAGSFEGAFAMQCLPHLVTTVNKSLRFKTHIKFTADASGSGGRLEMSGLTPLRHFTDDYGDVIPPTLANVTTTVRADGRFDLDIGKPHIAADANPISSNDIQFDFAIIRGILLGPKKFCGGLDGFVSQPSQIPLDAQDDFCVFEQVASDTLAGPGTLPAYVKDAFHCP